MKTLSIVLEQQEGALLRVLGTVERRGFRICEVQTREQGACFWQVQLSVEGDRPIQVLCRQLERLVEVLSAAVCF